MTELKPHLHAGENAVRCEACGMPHWYAVHDPLNVRHARYLRELDIWDRFGCWVDDCLEHMEFPCPGCGRQGGKQRVVTNADRALITAFMEEQDGTEAGQGGTVT
jgi:uncharacterized Zn finger protein